MSTDFSVVRAHFLAAIALGDHQKQIQYVQSHFPDPSEIRDQLMEMLRDHQNFDDPTGVQRDGPDTGSFGFDPEANNDFHPPVIERFNIGKKIGEGGFGEVYIAHQTEPISRTIALKVIKPGMGSKEVLARFEFERQILALMDHSCIAKIFDAGVTEAGNPFFAMELVSGKRITDFCNHNKLNVRQRLQLFLNLCDAIQHAHQKGVIHRDIKPSNVLCLVQDDLPALKVIDFGIAKALNPSINGYSFWTAKIHLVGTPLYMAPEQAASPEQNSVVDTRADIYSLGVLLYELLVGVTPIDRDSIDEKDIYWIREAIRSTVPLRPSLRVTSFVTSKRNNVCANRKVEFKTLNHWLRGDLDWIVMKAIEKEPDRRYATAKELKTDVENFLNRKPVIAGPPTSAYRLKKFTQRNWFAISAVVVVMISILGGLSLAIWQANSAKNDRDRAIFAERISLYRLKLYEDERVVKANALVKAQTAEANERKLRIKAEARDRFSRQLIYASDLRLANQAVNEEDVSRCLAILNRHIPADGDPDLRGFEWFFLYNLITKEHRKHQVHLFSEFCFSRFMPGGKYLVTGDQNGAIYLFDAKTESVIKRLPGHRGMINFADLSPDGSMLASAGDDGMIRLWQMPSGNPLGCFRAAKKPVNRVFFVLDNKSLISSHDGGEVRFWDVDSQKQIGQMGEFSNNKHHGIRGRLAVSPDRLRCVASDGYFKAKVFDLNSREEVGTLSYSMRGIDDSIRRAIKYSADGKLIAAGHGDNRISVWDSDSGSLIQTFIGHRDDIQDISFHPSSQLLVSSDRSGVVRFSPLAASTQESTDEVQSQWPKYIAGHTHRIWMVDFDSTGTRLVTAGKDRAVKIWSADAPDRYSLTSGDRDVFVRWINNDEVFLSTTDVPIFWNIAQDSTLVLDKLPSGISKIAVSLDGKRLATGHRSGALCFWDATSKQIIREWNPHNKIVHGLRFSSDGQQIFFGGNDPNVHVWNIASEVETKNFSVVSECNSISVSRNGRFAAYSSQNVVYLHSFGNPGGTKRLIGHKNTAEGVEFTPSGDFLVSVSDDRTIRVWSTLDGTEKQRILTHEHKIVSVAISRDGRTIASGDEMGNLVFSHLETGRPFFQVKMRNYWPKSNNPNPPMILDLQFSPNGKQLAVAVSRHGVVILDGHIETDLIVK